MNVVKDGEVYRVSRISGPRHNYLGLVFRTSEAGEITLKPRSLSGDSTAPQLDQTRLVAAVKAGVESGCRTFGNKLGVRIIEFVPNDTPDYETYEQLAKAILETASKDFA